jgi:hypothetical protein
VTVHTGISRHFATVIEDPEARSILTGYIAYLQNVPVCWRSKVQRGDTLSYSKTEYEAIHEAVKDINFFSSSCRLWSKQTILVRISPCKYDSKINDLQTRMDRKCSYDTLGMTGRTMVTKA